MQATTLNLHGIVGDLLTGRPTVKPSETCPPSSTGKPSDLLTERELEGLSLIADGLSNRESARELVLEVSTIDWCTSRIYPKLEVSYRTEAVNRAGSALGSGG